MAVPSLPADTRSVPPSVEPPAKVFTLAEADALNMLREIDLPENRQIVRLPARQSPGPPPHGQDVENILAYPGM